MPSSYIKRLEMIDLLWDIMRERLAGTLEVQELMDNDLFNSKGLRDELVIIKVKLAKRMLLPYIELL